MRWPWTTTTPWPKTASSNRLSSTACERLKASGREVIGVGDAENDFDLLAACGCGVAVANALPALAQRADMVTRSPGGHGVLELIDGLFPADPETPLA